MFNLSKEENLQIEIIAAELKKNYSKNQVSDFLKLLITFIFYLILIYQTYCNINPLSSNDQILLGNPRLESEQLFNILKVLKNLSNDNNYLMITILSLWLFSFQSLGIPGSLYPCILLPVVMDPVYALIQLTTMTMLASLACQQIYQTIGKAFMIWFASSKLAWFQYMIEKNKKDLWYQFFFVRTTPLLPNVLVNIFFGISEVPLKQVVVVNFIGMLPMNTFWIYVGQNLNNGEIISPYSVLVAMFLLSCVVILPKIIDYFKKKEIKEN